MPDNAGATGDTVSIPKDTVIDKTDLEGTSPANIESRSPVGWVATDPLVRKAIEGGQSRGSRERPC